MPARGRLPGTVLVAAAAATWGSWSLFFRTAEKLGDVSPALETFVVFAIASAAALPLALRDRPAQRRPASAWALLALYGLLDVANVSCFFSAMQRTTLAVAVLTHYLAPLFVALAAPLLLAEAWRRGTWAALAVSLAGLVLLLEPWRGQAPRTFEGALLGAASAFFYAACVLLAKKVSGRFSPREILAYHLLPGIPIVALLVPSGGFAVPAAAFGVLVVAGILGGVLAGIWFLQGLARIDAGQAAVLTLLEPLVAVLVGALVWGEVPGPLAVAGAALVLAGAWLVVRSPGGAPRAAAGAGTSS